jgi:tRNA threonylcarbamoyladenosine biosynthesis protein TsaB
MNILALETSTPYLVLGFINSVTQLEQIHRVERTHAEQITALLENFTTLKADIIAIGAGPGSYTGTRVAASYALGLARAWNAQVVRVPTLEAIAARESGVVAVSLNALRGNVYSAIYEVGSQIKTLVPLEKRNQEEFKALIPKNAIHLEDCPPSGIALARLARQRLEKNQNLDFMYL